MRRTRQDFAGKSGVGNSCEPAATNKTAWDVAKEVVFWHEGLYCAAVDFGFAINLASTHNLCCLVVSGLSHVFV
jgi:hypothetical protein